MYQKEERLSGDRQKPEQKLKEAQVYPFLKKYYEAGQVKMRFSEAGECISGSTKKGYQIIYILEGTVQIFSFCYNGKRVFLDQVGAGDFCGHISKVRGFNYESTLIARTLCCYLEISDLVFDELMKNKDFALEFYKMTSQRTYHMYQKTLALSLFSREENVAYYLLKNSNDRIIRGSMDSLSEEMGISRRSLCYLFAEWKKEGILTRCTGGYRITGPGRLKNLAKHVLEYYKAAAD